MDFCNEIPFFLWRCIFCSFLSDHRRTAQIQTLALRRGPGEEQTPGRDRLAVGPRWENARPNRNWSACWIPQNFLPLQSLYEWRKKLKLMSPKGSNLTAQPLTLSSVNVTSQPWYVRKSRIKVGYASSVPIQTSCLGNFRSGWWWHCAWLCKFYQSVEFEFLWQCVIIIFSDTTAFKIPADLWPLLGKGH